MPVKLESTCLAMCRTAKAMDKLESLARWKSRKGRRKRVGKKKKKHKEGGDGFAGVDTKI
ncbi:hypothetical protein SLEP1_g14594 [Rubroshorea leprosula]|uniref:Uncharacterized protein n=1 Tax=Rubroshorea leprosula TaxID=152421 RepID=A0AAV5IQF9_9ROSI|nr:hypothetical protein SLEP1_g14594 [Rubroshorea leprosula]